MERIDNFDFNKEIVLDPKHILEIETIDALNDFKIGENYFYYVEVNGDLLKINRQGYNNPELGTLILNLENLDETQKLFVIKTVYKYVFYKTGDLFNRVRDLEKNHLAQTHDGVCKTFFIDRNQKYFEYQIAEAIKQENPKFFNGEFARNGMHLN